MTRAILHLLLLIMLCQDRVDALALNCSPNNSCHCQRAANRGIASWRIFCSALKGIDLTVDLYHTSLSAFIRCHNMDVWPLAGIEEFTLTGQNISVQFDQCPWPDFSFGNIVENLENNTITRLSIIKPKLTISKLTRQNFSRLPRFDELWLIFDGITEFSADALQDLSHLRSILFADGEISILPRGLFNGLTQLVELGLDNNKMQRVNSLLFENLSKLTQLSLWNNYLKSLEPGTFKDLVNLIHLSIGDNRLTTLPTDIFKPLVKLQTLNMAGNDFLSLPHRLLIGNSQLTSVDFSRNRGNLSTLPDQFFANLTLLEYVYVSENNFTDLPEDMFVDSPWVVFLNLTSNKLKKLRARTFKNLTLIDAIELSHNELNNLPDGLFEGSLTSVDLQHNAITSISRNLFSNLNSCTTMKFDFNRISEIESWSFSNLTSLRHLSLRKNELTSLPENIFWGSFALEYVNISENKLTKLPVKLFRELTNLRSIRLNENFLSDLPEGIFQGLDNLLTLELQNNAFTTLPDRILAEAITLQNLHLEFNNMTEIELDRLWCLPSIRVASFSHNFITRIVTRWALAFECSKDPDLTHLTLNDNNITDFLEFELNNFRQLRQLNLSNNRISSLSLSSDGAIDNLVIIDVTRNNLKKLNLDDYTSKSPVHLYMEDNSITCDCDVYQWRKYFVDGSYDDLKQSFVIIADNLTCGQPKSMIGRPVKDLQLETFECELEDFDKPKVCFTECHCLWRRSDDTLVADCSNRNLMTPYEFNGFGGFAIELNLTGRSITEMSFFHEHFSSDYRYERVTHMFLSHNRIRNVTFDVVPPNLSVLHLDNNHLTRFHVAVAEAVRSTTSLQELALHSNPWSCDRETRESFIILKEKLDRKIGDTFNTTCLDSRFDENGDEKPKLYITYQIF